MKRKWRNYISMMSFKKYNKENWNIKNYVNNNQKKLIQIAMSK